MDERDATACEVGDLWRRHHREVYKFLLRRCGDTETAQDLTAETFLHASRAVRRGTRVTVGWLITVARRRLADQWRVSYRAVALRERLANDRTIRASNELDVALKGRLEQALNQLCDSQRSGLVLRYVQDQSVQQVADQLHLSYAATESLLSRGRRRLEREYDLLQLCDD